MAPRKPLDVTNTCEHGDHPAPDGKRFCSMACARCEHESKNEETGCDGICLGNSPEIPDRSPGADTEVSGYAPPATMQMVRNAYRAAVQTPAKKRKRA